MDDSLTALNGASTIDGLYRPSIDPEAERLRKNKPISMEMSEYKADPRFTEFIEQFKNLEAAKRTYQEEKIENCTYESVDFSNKYAIHSIIFGILSFFSIGITAIIGLGVCHISFQRKKYSPNKKWFPKAIIGIVLNVLGVAFWVVFLIIALPKQQG